MDMLKKSIGIGMLCFAGHAYSADITVTILDDVRQDDKECSLREAIEFVNLGLPEAGHMGCGGEKDTIYTTRILLKDKQVYTLKNKLVISKPVSILTHYELDLRDEVLSGTRNAILRMTGNEQLLHIDDQDAEELSLISLKEITLEGCKTDACLTSKGGLIYNREYLMLDYVLLDGGRAAQGGAIYNAGNDQANNLDTGLLEIKNSLFQNNHAQEGAVIYSQLPRFRIDTSVMRHNTTTNTTARSANIYTEGVYADAEYKFPFKNSYLINSTVYGNTGAAILIVDGVGVNNATIVANSAGVRFAVAKDKYGYLSNSIVLGNPSGGLVGQDCSFDTNDKSILQNNLTSNSCGQGDTLYPNQLSTVTKVIAGDELEGNCPSFSQDPNALLCPYRVVNQQFLGYFRPRISPLYTSWEQSPIINKGVDIKNALNAQICEGADQRGAVRTQYTELCDRGAIEVIVPTNTALVGKDIYYGEQATFSIIDKLGDSDLLPKEHCTALVGQHPKGEAWQDGCFVIEQEPHVTSKGTTTLDEMGNITYVPKGNWHGADLFTIKVITTSTKFTANNPYLRLRVNIVQEPKGEMVSDKIKTSGGSLGFLSVLGLFALVAGRRLKK